jgi:hypothetical protein
MVLGDGQHNLSVHCHCAGASPFGELEPGLLLLGNWIRPVGLSYQRPPSLLPGYFAGRASERPWTLRWGFFFEPKARLDMKLRLSKS